MDPPFLRWFKTCITPINRPSTLYPLAGGQGETNPIVLVFLPAPSGTEVDTVLLLGKVLPSFIWSGFPVSLATNHLFSECDIFILVLSVYKSSLIIYFLSVTISHIVLSINKPSLIVPSSQVTLMSLICSLTPASSSSHRFVKASQESLLKLPLLPLAQR